MEGSEKALIADLAPEHLRATAFGWHAAVQGFVLMMALLYTLLNLLVDVASTLIDPRVRFEG